MRTRWCVPLSLAVALLISLAGCAGRERDWEEAQRANSIDAYEGFLRRYPTGQFADEARLKVEELKWTQATTAGSLEGYSAYLQEFPSGRFADAARHNVQELEWKQVTTAGSVQGYEAFLHKYPSGPHADTARQALLRQQLERAGVRIQWKDDGSAQVVEGFPYRKDLVLDYKIEIVSVDKGVFTAAESSAVPTLMMGMGYAVAGGSFVARCSAEGGTQTLADAVGNRWVFAQPGIAFDVYLPGSKKPAYSLRSQTGGATISFMKSGVLVKGLEFVVASGGAEAAAK